VNFQASGAFTGLAAGDYTITAKDSHQLPRRKAVTITQPTAVVPARRPLRCNATEALTVPLMRQRRVHGGLHLLKGRGELPGFRGLHWPGCWRLYDHGERFAQLPRDQGGDDHTADGSKSLRHADVAAVQRRHGRFNYASASGGTAGYTFSKDGVNFQASGVFTGLAAGDYTITAKDSHNCLGTKAVTITQPTAVVASATPTAPQCNGALTVPLTRQRRWHGGLHSFSKDG